MTVPNFFIIGAPKCGTTALHSYLQQHPRVFMSPVKEPHYFCEDLPAMRRCTRERFYRKLFQGVRDEHIAVGEGSTRYLVSRAAVPRILDHQADAKFIVMVRNPVQMVHSYHAQLLYGFQEDQREFETAWKLQDARARGLNIPKLSRWPENLQYGEINKLGDQIERLLQIVPREQVKVIVHDDMCESIQSVFEDVLGFLGVPNTFTPKFERVNANKVWRSPRLGRFLMHTPFPFSLVKNGLKRTVPLRGRAVAKRVYLSLTASRKRLPPTPEMRHELVEYFRDDIYKLEGLLSRDLSHWLDLPLTQGGRSARNTLRAA